MGSLFRPKKVELVQRPGAAPVTTADPSIAESRKRLKVRQLNKQGRAADKLTFGNSNEDVSRTEAFGS